MIKKISKLALILSLSFSLTGCGLIPTLPLTADQSKIVAEYAAGLLLKHDKNYKGGIEDYVVEEVEEDDISLLEEQVYEPVVEEEPLPEESTEVSEDSDISSTDADNPDTTDRYSALPMADAIGLDGFDVTYASYESAKIYPEDNGELVFSMQANTGMELLILHFNLTNTSDSESLCDAIDSGCKYRLRINGTERVNSQHTILLNDLSEYYDNVAGFGMVDTVLVFEVAEGTSQNISSLDLTIKKDDMSEMYRIF